MLEIITDEKGILFIKNGETRRYGANSVRYVIVEDTVVFIEVCSRTTIHSEQMLNFTLNGLQLTPDVAEAELSAVFFLADGGAVEPPTHDQLANRSIPDQHPVSAITGLSDAIAGKVDIANVPQVVGDLSVNAGASSVGLNVTTTNPATGDETQTSTPLPIASETQMGMMPFESFNQIATNTAAIETLKGVGRVAAHLGTTPAQADISAAWTAAKGENIPDGATVVNLDQDSPAGHAWTYLSTSLDVFEWVDRGTDTVNQASNAAPGIVKGTDGVNGKVFIENDGTMSVVGWDDMPTQAEIDAAIEQAVSDHNVDETAHPDIRALIGSGGGVKGGVIYLDGEPTSDGSGVGESISMGDFTFTISYDGAWFWIRIQHPDIIAGEIGGIRAENADSQSWVHSRGYSRFAEDGSVNTVVSMVSPTQSSASMQYHKVLTWRGHSVEFSSMYVVSPAGDTNKTVVAIYAI